MKYRLHVAGNGVVSVREITVTGGLRRWCRPVVAGDGRLFLTQKQAAKALGLSASKVSYGLSKGKGDVRLATERDVRTMLPGVVGDDDKSQPAAMFWLVIWPDGRVTVRVPGAVDTFMSRDSVDDIAPEIIQASLICDMNRYRS